MRLKSFHAKKLCGRVYFYGRTMDFFPFFQNYCNESAYLSSID